MLYVRFLYGYIANVSINSCLLTSLEEILQFQHQTPFLFVLLLHPSSSRSKTRLSSVVALHCWRQLLVSKGMMFDAEDVFKISNTAFNDNIRYVAVADTYLTWDLETVFL